MNHVFCHLSSVTCQFLVAQNHLAAKVEPGNFCQHLIACGVNVFFACHASLSWPNAMGATVDGGDDDDDENDNVMSFSLCQGLPGKSA